MHTTIRAGTRSTTRAGSTIRRLIGALGLGAAGGAGLWLGGNYLVDLLQASAGATMRIDALITAAILAGGLILGAWYTLSALVAAACLGARLTGLVWAGGEAWVRRQGAPVMRRLLSGSAGAVLLAGSMLTPAHAGGAEGVADDEQSPVHLTWAPTSGSPAGSGAGGEARDAEHGAKHDRGGNGQGAEDDGGQQSPPKQPPPGQPVPEQPPPGQPVPEQPPPEEPAPEQPPPGQPPLEDSNEQPTTAQPAATGDGAPSSRSPGERVLVQPGDTLWSIAAADLGPGATDAQIAELWPRWYQANDGIITDPDLIHPGQKLTAPEGSTS